MRDMGERLSAQETATYFRSMDSNDDNVVDFGYDIGGPGNL